LLPAGNNLSDEQLSELTCRDQLATKSHGGRLLASRPLVPRKVCQ
jgi:hypothetical protein